MSAWLLVEIEISVVELGSGLEATEIEDVHATVLRLNQSHTAQFLQGTVHMHRGESQALAQLRLSQGELEFVPLGETDDAQPRVQLAEQVSHARERGPAAERQRPFAVDRGIQV